MSQQAIVIIPARGGSKGIPNKNLKTVGGKSLLSRAILSCKKSSLVTNVFVSTDSEQIAEVATSNGAIVIRRPEELSGDTASSESALLHALNEIENQYTLPEIVVFAQCTSPFIESDDVDGIIRLMEFNNCALTVTPNHSFIWRKNSDGTAIGINHNPEFRLPRQQLEPEFRETGALYAMNIVRFRKEQHRFFGNIGMFIVPTNRSIEIDDPEDLALANLIEQQNRMRPSKEAFQAIRAIVFDFDGVITDDQVYITETGEEMVMASRSDGMGISALKNAGYKLLILSKERNPVVAKRGDKLQIEVIQSCDNKLEALNSWLEKSQIKLSECAYIGNDINDLQCMNAVRLAVTPADAHPLAQQAAHLQLSQAGGKGAVRELSDLFLNLQ